MTISVVIPTKNRAVDLEKAINSIIDQTRAADELIIIDQSTESNEVQLKLQLVNSKTNLVYIHNNAIAGLVAAKAESLKHTSGEIICFLEDDVVLEREYLAEIEIGFLIDNSMLGCSGIVTNVPKRSIWYNLFFDVFHYGIFSDKRHHVYLDQSNDIQYIPSKILSGGLSAWRRLVFDSVKFDTFNNFHVMEDIDFSFRAYLKFGAVLYINKRARLAHYFSPANRDSIYPKNMKKSKEAAFFYRKHAHMPHATISFIWLMIGFLIVSCFESVRALSLSPVIGIISGIKKGLLARLVQ